jgi:hypothetical protein
MCHNIEVKMLFGTNARAEERKAFEANLPIMVVVYWSLRGKVGLLTVSSRNLKKTLFGRPLLLLLMGD